WKSIVLIVRPAVFDSHVLALDIAAFAQALTEPAQTAREHVRRFTAEVSDHRHRRLLRPRCHRPRRRRAAEQRYELAPAHVGHGEFLPRASACNATRDRNRPTTAHQINLQKSSIAATINRFAVDRQPAWVCGRDSI